MKRSLLTSLSFLLLLSGVGNARTLSSLDEERAKRQISQEAFSELRVEVEDLRHTLHGLQTEVAILDEKLHQQSEKAVTAAADQLQELKKRVLSLEKMEERVANDLKQLAAHTSESLSLFAQHEEKLHSIEQSIAAQRGELKEVERLGKTLSSIAMHTATPNKAAKSYKVQPRDNLEKIARKFHLSVEELKELNGLSHDTIFVGQELKLP